MRDVEGTGRRLAGGPRVERLSGAMPGIDLWWMRVGEARAGWLSDGERERMARFRFEADRLGFQAKRVLARAVLSAYGDVEPGELRFVAGDFGKPRLENFGVEFSLARSGEMAVCAVSRGGPVGVDVEDALGNAAEELPEWVLAPGEIERLRGVSGAARKEAFLRLWTLKEALVKGLGCGLSMPVERVEFVFGARGIEVEAPAAWDVDREWRFHQLRLDGRYVVALAARAGSTMDERGLSGLAPGFPIHAPGGGIECA